MYLWYVDPVDSLVVNVATGETSKTYSFTTSAAGTYYVRGLCVPKQNYVPGTSYIRTGSKSGTYSNDYLPPGFIANWAPQAGVPTPITVESSSPEIGSIDFTLISTYTAYSISGTVEGLSSGWLYVVVQSLAPIIGALPPFIAQITSETSKEYTLSEIPTGEYNVVAFITALAPTPDGYGGWLPIISNGDKSGAVSDGYFPPSFVPLWDKSGTPEVINMGLSSITVNKIPGLYSTYVGP